MNENKLGPWVLLWGWIFSLLEKRPIRIAGFLVLAFGVSLLMAGAVTYLSDYGATAEAASLQFQGDVTATQVGGGVIYSTPGSTTNETPIGVVIYDTPVVDPAYAACRQWAEANNAAAWNFDSSRTWPCSALLNGQWVSY